MSDAPTPPETDNNSQNQNPQPAGYRKRSESELDALAEITAADIAAAKAGAREFPELNALLQAKETDEGEE